MIAVYHQSRRLLSTARVTVVGSGCAVTKSLLSSFVSCSLRLPPWL